MSREEIVDRIKQVISDVTDIDPASIADDATFEALGLDSLSLLEIGVDIDYEYKLGVPDERLGKLKSIPETVDLVVATLHSSAPASVVA